MRRRAVHRLGLSSKFAVIVAVAFAVVALAGYQYMQMLQAARTTTQSTGTESGLSASSTTAATSALQLLQRRTVLLHPDHSFQFVNANVSKSGEFGAIAVTLRSNLPQSETEMLVEGSISGHGILPRAGDRGITIRSNLLPHDEVYLQCQHRFCSYKIHGERRRAHIFYARLRFNYFWGVRRQGLRDISRRSYAFANLERLYRCASNSTAYCGGEEGAGSIFFNQANDELYVGNSGTDSISVMNGSSDALLTTISLPMHDPQVDLLLYDAGNKDLYVGGQDTNIVFAIDTTTNFLAANITVTKPGQSVESLVYDPQQSGKIFAINFVYSLVSAIDDSTNNLVANITGIQAPLQGSYDPKTGDVYVQAYNGTIFVVDGKHLPHRWEYCHAQHLPF